MAYPDIECKYIDYHIAGYGEVAIESLTKWLYSNGPKPKFNVKDTKRKVIHAIHDYPAFPMKNLYTSYEDRDFLQPHEWLGMETSRGCIFKCSFCNFPVLGVKEDYSRSSKDFEIYLKDVYNKYGIYQYFITDETFNDRADKVAKLADVVDTLSFQPYFVGYIRADLTISRQLTEMDQLSRMGFFGHFYGVESFNHASGKSIGKGMHPDKIKQGLLDMKAHFMSKGKGYYRGTIGLIAGLPYETNETLDNTEQWLINNWRGQAVRYAPLLLNKKEDNSYLSKNYKEYGYSEIEGDPDTFDFEWRNKKDILKIKPIIWKNKDMNFFDVDRRTTDFNKKYSSGKTAIFKETGYGLIKEHHIKKTLDEKLNLTPEDFNSKENIDNIINHGHVKKYKDFKLNV